MPHNTISKDCALWADKSSRLYNHTAKAAPPPLTRPTHKRSIYTKALAQMAVSGRATLIHLHPPISHQYPRLFPNQWLSSVWPSRATERCKKTCFCFDQGFQHRSRYSANIIWLVTVFLVADELSPIHFLIQCFDIILCHYSSSFCISSLFNCVTRCMSPATCAYRPPPQTSKGLLCQPMHFTTLPSSRRRPTLTLETLISVEHFGPPLWRH